VNFHINSDAKNIKKRSCYFLSKNKNGKAENLTEIKPCLKKRAL